MVRVGKMESLVQAAQQVPQVKEDYLGCQDYLVLKDTEVFPVLMAPKET